MTLQRLTYLLCCTGDGRYSAQREILPNYIWSEEAEAWLDDAFADVGRLCRQRDEPSKLIPQNATKYDLQFRNTVEQVARDLAEKLEITL